MLWNDSTIVPDNDYLVFNAENTFYIGYYDTEQRMYVHCPTGEMYDPKEVKRWRYLDDIVYDSIKLEAMLNLIKQDADDFRML